jgi:hypothetical protein
MSPLSSLYLPLSLSLIAMSFFSPLHVFFCVCELLMYTDCVVYETHQTHTTTET